VVSLLTLGLFIIGGLTLSPTVIPLAVLLVLINIGYSISGWTVIDEEGVALWLITSWYLACTALFFAAMLGRNTEARLNALVRGCVIGGVIASLAACHRLLPCDFELERIAAALRSLARHLQGSQRARRISWCFRRCLRCSRSSRASFGKP
jgi:hypothetical protein